MRLHASTQCCMPHGCSLRKGFEWTPQRALLGIMLWSKCKWRRSVNAARKPLPTWLLLMKSVFGITGTEKKKEIKKGRATFMWSRWLIILLRCVWNSSVAVGGARSQSVQMQREEKPCAELRWGGVQALGVWGKIDMRMMGKLGFGLPKGAALNPFSDLYFSSSLFFIPFHSQTKILYRSPENS